MERESEEIVERTPKRTRREMSGSKSGKRFKATPKSVISYEDEDGSEASTPRLRIRAPESTSPVSLENSVNNPELTDNEDEPEDYEEEFDDDDEQDEDYGQENKKKNATPRKKKVAKRKLKDQWTISREFDDDISAEDYIETTAWFKDKSSNTDEGIKTFYFCGEASGKSCPAKAYSFISATEGEKVVLFVNEKEHFHSSGKRGIPEVVKREIRRILEENEAKEVGEILAKLAERKMTLPTKHQVRNYVTVKTKKPKIRLPAILKSKNERADSSDAESVSKKRKRRLAVHPSSSPES